MKRNPKPEDLKLASAINDCLNELETYGPEDKRYLDTLNSLERLMEVRKNKKPALRFSPDTMLIVAGNLLGILIIVHYERTHAMVSQAKNYTLKTL